MEELETKKLDEVIKHTLDFIDSSKSEIFDISESARADVKRTEDDLKNVKQETIIVMKELETIEHQLSKSKQKLFYVNRNYDKFTEEDFREAYENADSLRTQVAVAREKEKNMIQRRTDLEIRLKNSYMMVEKAENLISKVGVVFDFLSNGLIGVEDKLEDIQQKQGLGIKVIKAQEEERHRVARDIHDGPAQLMANIVLKAEICEKLIDIDLVKTKEELNNLKRVVRESLQDVRRIIYDLRPMSLDDLGLVPTVQRYANNFTESTEIPVKLKVTGEFENISSVVNLTAFRIIQESLNNIKKHAHATKVIVQIDSSDDLINVAIIDNGVGFDINNLKRDSNNIQSGFGLYSMQERLELINGNIKIESQIGKGTTVSISMQKNIE